MKSSFLVCLTSLLVACAQLVPQQNLRPVDTLYTNGVIWSGVPNAKDATVLAVDEGQIVFVGTAVPRGMTATRTQDLDGAFLMPGFIDNHVHFVGGGAGLATVDLRYADTPEKFINLITDYAQTLPEGRWVLKGNWDHELWGGELPTKKWIDEGTGDTPVFIYRLDGHMALANSAALKLGGVTKETKTPAGGDIVRDAKGEPTGILKDKAMQLVEVVIPEISEDELMEHVQLAQDHALGFGITEVHSVSDGSLDTGVYDIAKRTEEKGLVKLRIRAYPPISDWERAAKTLREKPDAPEARVKLVGVKGLVDGALGSSTAWLYDPYNDSPETTGFPLIPMEEFADYMAEADKAGLQLAIHAIGDRAIDEAVTAMKTIGGKDVVVKRFRIEHFQHPSMEAIEALAENGIVATMHPAHAADDGRWAIKRLGPDRIKTTYAFRTILDKGGILSFGTDWPVAPLNPMLGIQAAVTRQTTDGNNPDGWIPEEKITVEEALRAYTWGSAYAAGNEDNAGTLEAGKQADMIILSDDPRKVPPTDLDKLSVRATYIAGEKVYQPAN